MGNPQTEVLEGVQGGLIVPTLRGMLGSLPRTYLLSQKENMREKSVEEVAENTSPHREYMSTCAESNKSLYLLQGDEDSSTGSPTTDVPGATLEFTESTPCDMYVFPTSSNPVAEVDSTGEVDLGSFLARPVVIDTRTWATTDIDGPFATIYPWRLFLESPAVKKKIDNYAFMRGNLHVKFVINGTPFQYGLMRASYRPLPSLVKNKTATVDTIRLGRLIQRSQQPGVYLDPSQSAGGEMSLPFFYHKNWLDITSDADVANFGEIAFDIFAVLQLALSTGSNSVTIRTFAWMTDVELMGPTSKLTLQGDEYGDSPISGPATAVANVASYLVDVPIIGSFARATEIGARTVGKIASFFGFTNVPNISNVDPVYCMSTPHLATAEISVPYQKLALDPKTELSIDPKLFGLDGQDELSMAYLKKKESLFAVASWETSDAVDAKLLNARVTPSLNYNVSISNPTPTVVGYKTYHTPISYISQLFKHWRGSLKFRFKVVASKYHKGRLKIAFDPLNDISTTTTQTNEVYVHVLDLAETNEITIEIPYHQALAWLEVAQSQSDDWNYGTALAPVGKAHNGSISVSVFNALEAPVSPSSVNILCYVSGGDDFEFANPQGWVSNGGTSYVPSFFALQGEEVPATAVFGTPATPHPDRYGLNFGESVLSLRKLLHRSQIADTFPVPAGTGNASMLIRKSYFRMPYCPGYTPENMGTSANKVVAASGTADFAFNTMHMMTWISAMFCGYRGSTNFTVTVSNPSIKYDDIRIVRVTDAGGPTASNRWGTIASTILASASASTRASRFNSYYNLRDGLAGAVVSAANVAPSVQFTLPNNLAYNFALVNWDNYIQGSTVDGTNEEAAMLTLTATNPTSTDQLAYTTIQTAVGAGADFTCLFFLSTPVVYYMLGDATPT